MRAALVEAVCTALRERLEGCAVFDAPPARAAVPYAVVEEPVMTPWGTKSWDGFEARVTVGLSDEGERPVRLRALLGEAEETVADLPPDLGGGWRLVRAELVRSRIAKSAAERWTGRAEFLVRAWREG